MKRLPLHHLARLRRKLRRAMLDLRHRDTLRILEEWTGHRQPPTARHPMKFPTILLIIIAAAIACFFLTSCSDFRLAGLSVETPYGSITSDKSGATTVTLRPIVIGEK